MDTFRIADSAGCPGAATAPRSEIVSICASYGGDPHRMLDILRDIQDRFRWISSETMEIVAAETGLSRIQVEGVASFYSFLSLTPKGRVTIRLCDDIIDRFAGLADIAAIFERELGIKVGETTSDGAFSLDFTACIGMCDQAPAAMINDVVVTNLTRERAREIVAALKGGRRPEDIAVPGFDELTPHERATRMVANNIRLAGAVLLDDVPAEAGLARAMTLPPSGIVETVEASGLRGCGGAGFTTGRKWRFAAAELSERRFVICNADEGEPGTFKDRVLLTERPHLMVEGTYGSMPSS